MEERQPQRRNERSVNEMGAVKVSLVQRRKPDGSDEQPASSDNVAEYVEADFGLPTATMEVSGVRGRIKLDSCTRFTIAGTEWLHDRRGD
ncbi:hypothetical protein PC116_g29039 [Phytophthora cactorum]|nr:hypothetical protein PC114_g26998 [Phytophthora cactorum]KAG4222487.1 hypothetical protein PC116_g29039 [Phytophthora cactorum]